VNARWQEEKDWWEWSLELRGAVPSEQVRPSTTELIDSYVEEQEREYDAMVDAGEEHELEPRCTTQERIEQ
jgi:hypothetical protein